MQASAPVTTPATAPPLNPFDFAFESAPWAPPAVGGADGGVEDVGGADGDGETVGGVGEAVAVHAGDAAKSMPSAFTM